MMRKASLIFLGAVAGVGLTLLATQPHTALLASSAKAAAADTYRQLNLFGDVFERVRADYVSSSRSPSILPRQTRPPWLNQAQPPPLPFQNP